MFVIRCYDHAQRGVAIRIFISISAVPFQCVSDIQCFLTNIKKDSSIFLCYTDVGAVCHDGSAFFGFHYVFILVDLEGLGNMQFNGLGQRSVRGGIGGAGTDTQ